MRKDFRLRWIGFLGLWLAAVAAAHDTGPTFDVKVVGVADAAGNALERPEEGQPVVLTLALEDKVTRRRLTAADFEVFHEKVFHLLAYDRGLTNYVHEHPEDKIGTGSWTVAVTFARAGTYKLWANLLRKESAGGAMSHHHHHHGHHAGGAEETAMTEIVVAGSSPLNGVPSALTPKLRGNAGASVVRLYDPSQPGATELKLMRDEMAMIGIEFSRTDGKQPRIREYLGAQAHVVITDLKGTRLLHVHPMLHDGQLMLHTEFPEAGDYRVFVQYIDQQGTDPLSDLKTVELAVHVDSDF